MLRFLFIIFFCYACGKDSKDSGSGEKLLVITLKEFTKVNTDFFDLPNNEYYLNKALPLGLELNTQTGEIFGVSEMSVIRESYTLYNIQGEAIKTFALTIEPNYPEEKQFFFIESYKVDGVEKPIDQSDILGLDIRFIPIVGDDNISIEYELYRENLVNCDDSKEISVLENKVVLDNRYKTSRICRQTYEVDYSRINCLETFRLQPKLSGMAFKMSFGDVLYRSYNGYIKYLHVFKGNKEYTLSNKNYYIYMKRCEIDINNPILFLSNNQSCFDFD